MFAGAVGHRATRPSGIPAMTEQTATVKVWDIFVRIFHWSFAATIIAAWLTQEWADDGGNSWHDWLGYTALGLAIARIIWGFIGTRYARFSDFVHWPAHYVRYMGELLTGRDRRPIGHNPLGGLMILILLGLAIGTGVTGYFLTENGSNFIGEDMEDLHEVLGNLFLIAVPLHILGVVWESVRHKENLTKAMITGRKRA